jgi:hypothetical protein
VVETLALAVIPRPGPVIATLISFFAADILLSRIGVQFSAAN